MQISVKMTEKELFQFSMYTAYSGFMGIISVLFTLAAIAVLFITWGWVTVYQKVLVMFCILIFPVVQPALLWTKAKKTAQLTGFQMPISLNITDEKIAVEQAGVTGDFTWNQVWAVVRTKTMFIIKTGPTHGYLIPNETVAGREQEFIDICKRNLSEKKTKGLKP